MAKPRKLSPEALAAARAKVATGVSIREVAAECGVSHETLRLARRRTAASAEAGAAAPSAVPAAAADADALGALLEDTDALPPAGGDELAFLIALRERFLRFAAKCEAAGNLSAAQRAGRDAAQLAPTIARLTRDRRSEQDTVQLSREEIEKAFESIRDRAAVILSRPLLCAKCSRSLSAQLAGRPE